jgi:Lipocalin-like domain
MRNILVLVACLCAFSAAVRAQSTESEVRKKIVGTWKVVSSEETLKDGSKRPNLHIGLNGKAFLLYSADGYMCAELMNSDRPGWKDKNKPSDDEKLSSFNGFFAYCGRYEIHADKNYLVHLPEVSMTQDYLETRQIRPYRFEGNRLILGDKSSNGNDDVVAWEIVWEKVQ